MDELPSIIPIKSLCNIIQEYYYYPRPYLKEMENVTLNLRQKIDDDDHHPVGYDLGCTSRIIFSEKSLTFKLQESLFYDICSEFMLSPLDKKGKLHLYEKENERRKYLGLKVNRYIFGVNTCSATNRCYMGY